MQTKREDVITGYHDQEKSEMYAMQATDEYIKQLKKQMDEKNILADKSNKDTYILEVKGDSRFIKNLQGLFLPENAEVKKIDNDKYIISVRKYDALKFVLDHFKNSFYKVCNELKVTDEIIKKLLPENAFKFNYATEDGVGMWLSLNKNITPLINANILNQALEPYGISGRDGRYRSRVFDKFYGKTDMEKFFKILSEKNLNKFNADQAMAAIKLYRAGSHQSPSQNVDRKDNTSGPSGKLTQLQEAYAAVQDIDNPTKLSPDENKAMGELMLDVLHNAKPGMTFNKNYLYILAQDNYNNILLKAFNFLKTAEEQKSQQEKMAMDQQAPKDQAKVGKSNEAGLDQKDALSEQKQAAGLDANETKIPNHDLLRAHLAMTQYFDESKDFDNALVKQGDNLDIIAGNIEKRKALAEVFANDASWKTLTQFIQKHIANGKMEDPFVANLIVQKFRCEAELDPEKRNQHMKSLQEMVNHEMSKEGSSPGLWDKSINIDLKQLSEALQAKQAQVKVLK